ncbi:hypothetical protein BB560_003023 [Smittium megazygosporum]|uniref:Peptidase M20 dimerisation domain-containing protein n=1 Tax=Smittium megazygosporum TaxID=133381 RepID=A0A2T9ZD93_9FUNG|nr:hypothetical protein BB560_003023 [Smittium megazygosporum]
MRHPDIKLGLQDIGKIRMGCYWTAQQLAKAGLIPKMYIERCPFCNKNTPETIEHMLIECFRWNSIRHETTIFNIPRLYRTVTIDQSTNNQALNQGRNIMVGKLLGGESKETRSLLAQSRGRYSTYMKELETGRFMNGIRVVRTLILDRIKDTFLIPVLRNSDPRSYSIKIYKNSPNKMSAEPPSVSRFREYLRIPTIHPKPDYETCKQYLQRQAEEIGLEFKSIEYAPGKPTIILTLVGTNPEFPSIILNSHTDVVPVFEEFWDYPPFSAERVPDGDDFRIYARGSQDMKVVGSCYLEAIRNLKAAGKALSRTLHLTFVPDEEIGGEDGMAQFVKSQDFKDLNAGFALDEGISNPGPELYAFYGERSAHYVKFTARGETGHGSQFIKDTAISKLVSLSNELLEFRDSQENRLVQKYGEVSQSNLGEVTTLNINMLEGGVQANVVPENFSAVVDIRVTPFIELDEFKRYLKSVADKHKVEIEYIYTSDQGQITDISDNNKFWTAFKSVLKEKRLKSINAIFPAATDSRYLRDVGIPAIGISPLRNIPALLHVHNEFIYESLFLEGIDMYTGLIYEIGNVQ